MTEPAHYKRGPSGASRWLICTDSPEAEDGYPDSTSDAADEGTAAHWLLEQCLTQGQDVEEWLAGHCEPGCFGRYVPAGEETGCIKDWPITGEMIEAVQLAIDTVNEQAKKRGTRLLVEERVMVPDHYGLQDQVGGTADIIMYLPKSKTLYVLDFKYGRGHVVEVDDKRWGINPQVGLYTTAALGQLERLIKKKVEVKWVIAGIIQPRAYHKKGAVRTKKITPFQLMDLEIDLVNAVNGPKVRVAGDHCHFCRAKPDCEEYHAWRGAEATAGFEVEAPAPKHSTEVHPSGAIVPASQPEVPALQDVGSFLSRPVKGLTLKELAVARQITSAAKAWAKEVDEEVRTRLLHDLKVPGVRLAQGPGSRAYGGTQKEIEAAALVTAERCGVDVEDLYVEPVPKSPAQLEKQLGKAKFKQTPLAALVATKAGGPVVVDEDSNKPEYIKDGGFEAESPPEEKPIESSLL